MSHSRTPVVVASADTLRGRIPWLVLGVSLLALHGALLGGGLDALHAAIRVAAAFIVIVMGPGLACVRLGVVAPGGVLPTLGWASGFGVAWNAVIVLAARWAGHGVSGLETSAFWTSALLWAVALVMPRRPADPATEWRMGRGAATLVLLAGLATALYVGWVGPVLTYQSDGADHVGTIRRIMTSGDAFPEDAFFRDAGPDGVDPRKGVWHPQVAMISQLANEDPMRVWRWLPVVVAPLFVFSVALLGLLAAGSRGAAIGAWGFLLTFGGTIASTPLRHAAYSSRLAEHLALAVTAALLADLLRPSARLRVAAMVLAFAATTTHLFAVVQIAIPIGALGIAMLVRDRGPSPSFMRLLSSSLLVGVACLPFLLWRAQHAYAPVNVIHTEPQGLLYLADGWPVLSLGLLWMTFSIAWVLFPLAWIPLWKWGRRDPVALWVLAGSLTAALLMYNPLIVKLLEPRLGYLMMRFLWFVPLAVLLAWAVPRIADAIRTGNGRWRAVSAACVMAFTLAPAIADAVSLVRRPPVAGLEAQQGSILRWRDALEWMREHLPAAAVVLSDPVTSYSIPMGAGRYVVTLVDQHSSPNDPLAVERLLDARDALDPYAGWDRVREVVARYRVDHIALNDRFDTTPRLHFWGPTRRGFAAMRARLDRHPEVFEPVFDTGDFVVYRVDHAALGALREPAPARPYVVDWRPGEFPDGRRAAGDVPALLDVRIPSRVIAAGDTLRGVAEWRATDPLPPGSYSVAIRLDRPLPDGMRPPGWMSKPFRKVLERLRGERFRLGFHHLPTGGIYGVDRWGPREVIRDSFAVAIPRDADPGHYVVRVGMVKKAHFVNLHLRDYLDDDDLFSGEVAGPVEIVEEDASPLSPRGDAEPAEAGR